MVAGLLAGSPTAHSQTPAGEKPISFEMRNKPWPDVLEWLADQSGLEVVSSQKPTGTVTFIAPRNKAKKYTIPQIIDILNEQLMAQKMVLVRRTNSFTILSSAGPIDSALLPRVEVGDLANRGDTELVTLVLPLNALVAEEIVPEVKTMLGITGNGPPGVANVTPLERSNQLILQGTVAQLKRVIQNLKENEDDEKKGESYTYVCRFIHPQEAEKILKEQLEVQPPAPMMMPGQMQMMMQQMPGGPPGPKTRKPRVSSDDRTRTVIVSGTADKLALAKKILTAIDVPGDPTTRTELIPLNTLDANKIVDWLQKMHGEAKAQANGGDSGGGFRGNPFGNPFGAPSGGTSGEAKVGLPFIEADASRNAIIVKGSPEQITAVKASIRALGEDAADDKQDNNMRTITLEKGSASTLAEALERLLPQMRKNPVIVVIPGGENRKKPAPAVDNSLVPGRPGTRLASNGLPGRADAPITLTAFGNKLIVTCDEAKALSHVQELTRLLTQTAAGEGDFEIVRLHNTSAEDAARVIDEAFNGNKNDRNNNNNRFFWYDDYLESRRNKKPDRIRVVADKQTNSLLVRANPLDMLTIRRLVERTIDNPDNQSKVNIKTWVIGPLKAASAKDVASLIKDIYREHLNNTLSAYQSGALRQTYGGYNGINLNTDASGNPRAVDLTVSVDEQTNSLVVSCTEQLHGDIAALVEKLDEAAKNSKRTVRVISVKGIDPVLVQKAIDAIQGKARSGTGTGSSTNGGNNSNGNKNTGPGDSTSSLLPDFSRKYAYLGEPGSARAGPPGRGPDFFVDRVTDDPQWTTLYDPQQPPRANPLSAPDDGPLKVFQLVKYEEQQPGPGQRPAPPGADQNIVGPRAPVTAEALEQLGVIVISGNNPADVEEVIRMVEFIQKLGSTAEIQLHLVSLEFADATSVAATLTHIYQRVIVNASGNTRAPLTPSQPQPQQPQQQPQPGQPAPEAQAARGPQGQNVQQTQQQELASVTLVGLPRLNAILFAAPKARVDDIVKEIKRLDLPPARNAMAVPFPLRKAAAAKVDVLLNNFYAVRFPNEIAAQHHIRVTHDDSTNTVFVQAAPADMAEIRSLIQTIDTTVSSAVNDVRVVHLNNAVADDMAGLLMTAISQGVIDMTATGPFSLAGTGGAQRGGAAATPPAIAPQTPGVATPGATGMPAQTQPATAGKRTTLRFISPHRDGVNVVESGLLEDIHITPDIRTNSLILAAPTKTIELLLAMIRELDALPAARAEVNIFTLRKADARFTANMLLQLFYGGGSVGGQSGAVAPVGGGPTLAAGGVAGANFAGLPTQNLNVTSGATGGLPGTGAGNRPIFTLGGSAPDGTPLVDLHITIDERTNSLIVAASRNDLDIIQAIISRLEDSDTQIRRNEVYRLKNLPAVDAAAALNDFLQRSLRVLQTSSQLTAYQEVQRDVIIAPEPINNSLLISATPARFDELMNLLLQLDARPPQVMIQVLIAEVELSDTHEFGVELGAQSPVLFQRSIYGPGSYNFTDSGNLQGILPGGVTINNATTPTAIPGYNFNSTLPLGNSALAPGPGIVGYQAISNLGVGRVSPISNVGGLVFSVGSDALSVLVRALQTQGRIDILSRPQIMTMDNQTARINIGQQVPLNFGSNVSVGVVSNNIQYVPVGVILTVTPRISPDGTVLMRVAPQVSDVSSQTVSLGNGQTGTILDVQQIETTVLAQDGETVAIGGMITKHDVLNENKVPCLGDLPYLGTLFRYRTAQHSKTELLVILTPHIIRCPADADHLLGVESGRMQWRTEDVMKVHATTGMEPVLASPPADMPGLPQPMGPSSAPPAKEK
jgi:type II secretion system protein D